MQFPATTAITHQLTNGLTVILDADSSAPVISTQAWVASGSIHEGPLLGSGLSHMLEHMVFKGTESYDGKAISDTVQAAGGEWNAYTTFDRTVYYIDGPAESSEAFLKVLTEMVFKPSFPIEDFEKEKDVIRREIDMGVDDPDDQNAQLLYTTAYTTDPRCKPIIGHLELFNQLTHDHMTQYHKARYTTDNTFLSISGDFVESEMTEYLESITATIPRSFTEPAPISPEPDQIGMRLKRKTFDIPTTKLSLAWQTPGLEHSDSPALDLLSTILGSGRSCRLYQNIRETTNLCHHIGAWSSSKPQLPGMFCVSAIVDHEKRDELQSVILKEIAHLSTTDFTAELEKAKRMSLVSQFSTLSTASGRASDLASNWHDTRNLNFTKDYVESLSGITSTDLQRVAQTYLIDSKLTITSLDPEDSEEAQHTLETTNPRGSIKSHTLSNGLTVITQKDSRLPTVFITLATLTGLPSETPQNSGINSLLAKLLPKGSSTRSAEEIANITDSLGASFGFSCGNNTTLASATCLSPDISTIIEIVADLYQNPLLPEDALERERDSMIASLQEQASDPLSVAFRKLRPSLFGETGYGLNTGGTEESLLSLTRNDLTAHHEKYFTAKNAVISISGDIDPTEVIKLVEAYFKDLPSGERVLPSSQPHLEPSEHTLTLDKQQAVLTVGYLGASATDTDNYALELIIDYCTDMAGPLFSKIREELGLAYYVSATQFHGVNTGMVAFYLGTSPDQLETARVNLMGEIELIANNGIPEEVLESVKTTWLASNALANQKLGSLSRLSAIDSLLGFSPDHHSQAPDHIRALTSDDIRTAALKYFGTRPPVIVSVTP